MLSLIGTERVASGAFEDGIDLLEDAVDAAPRYAPARNNLAVALLRTGRGDEAVGHLDIAIDADPKFADARVNLARYYAGASRLDDALALVEPVLREGYHGKAMRVRAQVAIARGDGGELVKIFAAIAEHEHTEPGAWVNLGKAQLQSGDRSGALVSFERAGALAPEDPGIAQLIRQLR